MDYNKERKLLLEKLKEMGVTAPASMYPSDTHDDNKEGQIDRMKAHLFELAEFKSLQQQNNAQ